MTETDEDGPTSVFRGRRIAVYLLLLNLAFAVIVGFALPSWSDSPPSWAYQVLLGVAVVLVLGLALLTRRPTVTVPDAEILRRDETTPDA